MQSLPASSADLQQVKIVTQTSSAESTTGDPDDSLPQFDGVVAPEDDPDFDDQPGTSELSVDNWIESGEAVADEPAQIETEESEVENFDTNETSDEE
jgi:hypothetical protein